MLICKQEIPGNEDSFTIVYNIVNRVIKNIWQSGHKVERKKELLWKIDVCMYNKSSTKKWWQFYCILHV